MCSPRMHLDQGFPTWSVDQNRIPPETGPHKQGKPHLWNAGSMQNHTPFGPWKSLSPPNWSLGLKRGRWSRQHQIGECCPTNHNQLATCSSQEKLPGLAWANFLSSGFNFLSLIHCSVSIKTGFKETACIFVILFQIFGVFSSNDFATFP